MMDCREGGAKRDQNSDVNNTSISVPRTVAHGKFLEYLQRVTAQGYNAATALMLAADDTADEGMATTKEDHVARKMANAKHVRRWGRHNRKRPSLTNRKTLIAGNYAKIAARPQRPYHAIVSCALRGAFPKCDKMPIRSK